MQTFIRSRRSVWHAACGFLLALSLLIPLPARAVQLYLPVAIQKTAAPTANDDTADGYDVGTLWLDTTNDVVYIAIDVTTANAVWVEIPDIDAIDADTLDGIDSLGFVKAAGTVALSANWDAGAWEIRAQTFESDVATGTAPFTIASTTVSTNLNADLLDGESASAFQDADADLTTYAGITPSANVQTLLGAATFAAFRSSLSLDTADTPQFARLTLSDSATNGVLHVTERAAEPSAPASGEIYLDDGTNTASGSPGWRRWTGAAWEDIGGTSAVSTFTDLTDTPVGITANQYVRGNALGTALEFAALSFVEVANATQYFAVPFVIADEADDDPQHFEIDIDDTATFASVIVTWDSRDVGDGGDGQTGCAYFNGTQFAAWTAATGVTAAYEGNAGCYYFQSASISRGTVYYVRIRFHDGTSWGDYQGWVHTW